MKQETGIANPVSTWYQPDRLGSHAQHHPYGEPRGANWSETPGFATYWREPNGIDYADQRYYSSTYGRFLTPDPYRASGGPSDAGSWNRYAYVEGDPVNFNDPHGLASCKIISGRVDERGPMAEAECFSAGGTEVERVWVPSAYPGPGKEGYQTAVKDAEASLGRLLDAIETNRLVSLARTALEAIQNRSYSFDCDSWLRETLQIDVQQLKHAAGAAMIHNGLLSTDSIASLYANARTERIRNPSLHDGTVAIAMTGTSTSAMAQLGGSNIYLNPAIVNTYGSGGLEGMLFHELLHNITGLVDPEIQTSMGLSHAGGSVNISLKVIEKCYR